MEPLALPSSSHNDSGHHLHRPLVHANWGFEPPSAPAAAPPPDLSSGSSYEASVVATSLLPPGDAWSHHPMLATPAPGQQHHWGKEEEHAPGSAAATASGDGGAHDDSGISPGRTSSSGGPSSNGGSPPAAGPRANEHAPSPPGVSKSENQDGDDDCRSSPVTHDEDSSEISDDEDTMDSLSRLQMALSQSGSPLGDIYNASGDDTNAPVIQCPLCSHIASTLPSLAAHLSTHVEQRSDITDLHCPACNYIAPDRDDFVSHLGSHLLESNIALTTKSSRRCSVCDFATKCEPR